MHGPVPQLHDYIINSAARLPDKVAVVYGDDRVTYAELDARSNALAFVGRADPDARAFAKKFTRNEHALVMNQAARILRAPKKK